jgi:hypothetical protein
LNQSSYVIDCAGVGDADGVGESVGDGEPGGTVGSSVLGAGPSG